jgi:3-hydroxyisobutyrate dehydrogenase-like beta-hydroxyacid dehydrogenase
VIVGLAHPGEMGSALGDALCENGHEVIWASEGRSDATRGRAVRFRDVGSLAAFAGEAQLVLSVCPPHAALEVARAVEGIGGVYVDANAISPARAREIAAVHRRYVDGGIVGPPPRSAGETRLYLSGAGAAEVAALFDGSVVEARVVPNASALKMAYAAWSKGTAALLIAIRDVARHYGVGEALDDEWDASLHERLARAERSAAKKGWRWIGEMEEIADTFAAAGEPDGFHRAAAEVYRRAPGRADA